MEPRKIDDRLHMNKHIGVRVCEVFEGDRYHDEVTDVRFHDIHTQYMYHVVLCERIKTLTLYRASFLSPKTMILHCCISLKISVRKHRVRRRFLTLQPASKASIWLVSENHVF